MSHSPWGHIQDTTQVAPGVRWVSTAGHGGLMVAKATAERLLSTAAREAADFSCGCYCFEEDCLYAVAFYEHPEWQRALDIERRRKAITRTDDEYRDEALLVVATWNVEYLEARGFTAVKTCLNCGDVCLPYRDSDVGEGPAGYSKKCTHPDGHSRAVVTLTPATVGAHA